MTRYRVLRERHDSGVYEFLREVEANGSHLAIRAVARQEEDWEDGVTFVAVPVTNWTEQRVTIETPPPRLKLGPPVEQIEGQATIEDTLDVDERLPEEVQA